MMVRAAREAGNGATAGANTLMNIAAGNMGLSDLAIATIGALFVATAIAGMTLGNYFSAPERGETAMKEIIAKAFASASFGPNDYMSIFSTTDPPVFDHELESEEGLTTRSEERIPPLTDILGHVFFSLHPISDTVFPPTEVAAGFENACSEFFQQYLLHDIDHTACTIVSHEETNFQSQLQTEESYDVVIAIDAIVTAETGFNDATLVNGVNDNMAAFVDMLHDI